LGLLNLCFFVTTRHWPIAEPWLGLAGWGFVAGAIAMPICCVLMAHWPRAHCLFALPVSCLLLGGITVLACVGRSQPKLDSPAPLLSKTPHGGTSAL
jgi:hypothetical protein